MTACGALSTISEDDDYVICVLRNSLLKRV
jgi:hypothetical protein